jgi:hypothetical protein
MILIDEYTFLKHIMISLNFVHLDQMRTQSHYTKLIVMVHPKDSWIFQHLMLFEIRMLRIFQYFCYIGNLWHTEFFGKFFSFRKKYFQKRISYYKKIPWKTNLVKMIKNQQNFQILP